MFIITALPRCRTTWLANYLTTDNTICYHDTLASCDSFEDFKVRDTGTIETGLWMFPDFIEEFDGTKIFLGRNPKEVQISANLTGMYAPLDIYTNVYEYLKGQDNYYDMSDLKNYNKVSEIAERTIGIVPRLARFNLLTNMKVNTLGF